MFMCLECGKRFRSAKAAEKAMDRGCPKCGGCDIDLAPEFTDASPDMPVRTVRARWASPVN